MDFLSFELYIKLNKIKRNKFETYNWPLHGHEFFDFAGLSLIYNWKVTQLFVILSGEVKAEVVEIKYVFWLLFDRLWNSVLFRSFHLLRDFRFDVLFFWNVDVGMLEDVVGTVLYLFFFILLNKSLFILRYLFAFTYYITHDCEL